ncbi:MAG: hypothetical protein F7B17_05735 [Desulfurococcales archaeon]|nr:hypothetical protein [Desulfurococcales archaeon]
MRAVRLVEGLGGLFFLGLSLWAWLEVLGLPLGYFGDLFVNLFWLAAALEVLGGFLLLDLLLGSVVLGRLYRAWHSRAASLPYEVSLGRLRLRIGSPEALALATPFWLAAMLLLASTIIAYDSPTPVFMLQFTMMAEQSWRLHGSQ